MFLHPGVCVTSLGYNEATHSQQNCFPGEVETHGVHLSLPLMLTLITWSRCSLTPTPTPRDPLHHRELVGIWARRQKTAWSSTVSSQTACGLEGKLSGYDDAAQSLIPGMAPGRWRCPFSARQGGGGVGWLQPAQQPCLTGAWALTTRLLLTQAPWDTPRPACGGFHSPSRVQWRRKAHPGSGGPILLPQRHLGVAMSNWGPQPPPVQGAPPSASPGCPVPLGWAWGPLPSSSPSLLLSIRLFISPSNIHNAKATSGDLPCLKRWREAAMRKEKLNRPWWTRGEPAAGCGWRTTDASWGCAGSLGRSKPCPLCSLHSSELPK